MAPLLASLHQYRAASIRREYLSHGKNRKHRQGDAAHMSAK
jgi:hypothetical protein